jgi:hypothetical protein
MTNQEFIIGLVSYIAIGFTLFILMAWMAKHLKEVPYDSYVGFFVSYIFCWPILWIHFAIVLSLFLQEKLEFKRGRVS